MPRLSKKEKRDKARLAKKEKREKMMALKEAEEQKKHRQYIHTLRQHGVFFYHFDDDQYYRSMKKAETEPRDFEGDYDIIFVSGGFFCRGEGCGGVNRTAKGTARLTETNITVKVDDEVRKTSDEDEFHYISDFHVNNLESTINTKDSFWECTGRAKVEEYEPAFHVMKEQYEFNDFKDTDGTYPKKATIFQVTNRIACPWVKKETYWNSDCNVEVKFDTLEDAVKLYNDYENRHQNSWLVKHKGLPLDMVNSVHSFCAHRPSPVFFFEPGDLVLEVKWIEDYALDVSAYVIYILRKRSALGKRKLDQPDKKSNKK